MSTGGENCIGQLKTPLLRPDGESFFSIVLLGSATLKICIVAHLTNYSADAINMQPIEQMLHLDGNMLKLESSLLLQLGISCILDRKVQEYSTSHVKLYAVLGCM